MSDLIEIFPDGTEIVRDYTEEEIKQRAKDVEDDLKKAELEAENLTKRENALAKLSALGLDMDDLKALGLG